LAAGLQFRDKPIAIRYQNGLALASEPDVLAQLIFQYFQADGLHATNSLLEASLSNDPVPPAGG
jgi:hypothetical protein